MARYDKYDGTSGGFRAALDEAWSADKVGAPVGVGLSATTGRVVAGVGDTDVIGVLVLDAPKNAGDTVDVMTSGEVVDCEGLAAGTVYYAAVNGDLSATNSGTDTPVGFTAEADRLLVRVGV